MHPAAEAVVELFVGADGKRRGFLVVKGAARLEILAHLGKRHARVNDVHDVDARKQLVNKGLGDSAGHRGILYQRGSPIPAGRPGAAYHRATNRARRISCC